MTSKKDSFLHRVNISTKLRTEVCAAAYLKGLLFVRDKFSTVLEWRTVILQNKIFCRQRLLITGFALGALKKADLLKECSQNIVAKVNFHHF